MNSIRASQFIGTHLKDCYVELDHIGALRSWAPYCLDLPSLKGVGARFSNHWGEMVTPDVVEYMITVTDREGLITHSEVVSLKGMESGEFQLRSRSGHPELGAMYFGCVSSEITEWISDQTDSVDYFYLAYESGGSYSLLHSQPFHVTSKSNLSSWPTCIEVLSAESPRILLGNPSVNPSNGYISIGKFGGGRSRQFQTNLEPFQVAVFDLNVVPDGWYNISCLAGKEYSQLVRSHQEIVLARHL